MGILLDSNDFSKSLYHRRSHVSAMLPWPIALVEPWCWWRALSRAQCRSWGSAWHRSPHGNPEWQPPMGLDMWWYKRYACLYSAYSKCIYIYMYRCVYYIDICDLYVICMYNVYVYIHMNIYIYYQYRIMYIQSPKKAVATSPQNHGTAPFRPVTLPDSSRRGRVDPPRPETQKTTSSM